MESIKRVNISKLLLVVFILGTILSGFSSAIPIYESPTASVTSVEIPEYQLSITNKTWVQPERILLANLTPKLEDPSWESSEWRQNDYSARIETNSSTSILYFNNDTAINETYTYPDHAGWDLVWPFAVLNYSELTVEWQIRVIRGNITVYSLLSIARGIPWGGIWGSYVSNSSSEMSATAPEEITLVSSASNFTEQFSTIDVGILWAKLDIRAAQGSIVAVDNVKIWISTDEPLCQVTLDFQSLYGLSLFSNPSIVSQWLGTYSYYSFHEIGEELAFYLKSITPISAYGFDLMLMSRSNQTAYLAPGNYSLILGWSDMHLNDEYIFNMTLQENTSHLFTIPLPLNPVMVEVNPSQVPGNIGVNYLDRVNISGSEDVLFIIPECETFSVRFSIPGYDWGILEIETSEGLWSEVFIDLNLVPFLGILFTQQQITAISITAIFAILSLVMLLYRWRSSKKESYLNLVPLLLFFIGLALPWYVRTESYSYVDYTTYLTPILGYRIWSSDGLFLTIESLFFSEHYIVLILPTLSFVFITSFTMLCCLYDSKAIDILLALSIIIFAGGSIGLLIIGGIPWLGFWSMLAVPPLSYVITNRIKEELDKTKHSEDSEQQSS